VARKRPRPGVNANDLSRAARHAENASVLCGSLAGRLATLDETYTRAACKSSAGNTRRSAQKMLTSPWQGLCCTVKTGFPCQVPTSCVLARSGAGLSVESREEAARKGAEIALKARKSLAASGAGTVDFPDLYGQQQRIATGEMTLESGRMQQPPFDWIAT
jgi:hypothetical protein